MILRGQPPTGPWRRSRSSWRSLPKSHSWCVGTNGPMDAGARLFQHYRRKADALTGRRGPSVSVAAERNSRSVPSDNVGTCVGTNADCL